MIDKISSVDPLSEIQISNLIDENDLAIKIEFKQLCKYLPLL